MAQNGFSCDLEIQNIFPRNNVGRVKDFDVFYTSMPTEGSTIKETQVVTLEFPHYTSQENFDRII